MRRIFVPILGLCVIAGLVGGPSASAANNAKRRPQRLAGTVQDSLGRPVAGRGGQLAGRQRQDRRQRPAATRRAAFHLLQSIPGLTR